MTEAATVIKTTILRTREDVTTFLSAFPDLDVPITWTCPECGTVNPDAYYSHKTPCMNCSGGYLPALSTPIKCKGEVSIKIAVMKDHLEKIDQAIEGAQEEIAGLSSDIDELEDQIRAYRHEKKIIEESIKGISAGGA